MGVEVGSSIPGLSARRQNSSSLVGEVDRFVGCRGTSSGEW